jgi:hypothetical protein
MTQRGIFDGSDDSIEFLTPAAEECPHSTMKHSPPFAHQQVCKGWQAGRLRRGVVQNAEVQNAEGRDATACGVC